LANGLAIHIPYFIRT